MGKLDPDDARPPYQQLEDHLRRAIDAGEYGPGEKLPSYDAVAGEYGVSVGTVKRAFGRLRDDGVIVIRHGEGSFVRTRRAERDHDGEPADDNIREIVSDLAKRLEVVERRLSEM